LGALMSLRISWSLICKMTVGCHLFSGDHSLVMSRQKSTWGPEWFDSALGTTKNLMFWFQGKEEQCYIVYSVIE
jgi:hypothetical protein